jgi:hypothetical protein
MAILLLGILIAIFPLANNLVYASTINQYRLTYDGDMYIIEYSAEHATIDNIEVDLEKMGLVMQIGNTTASGDVLTVTLPRNLIDSVCGNEDLPFIIKMNDKELLTGRDPATNEVEAIVENRTIALALPSMTDEIFIGTFSSPTLSGCSSLSLTPNEQQNGVRYESSNPQDIADIAVDKEQTRITVSLSQATIRDSFLKLELSRSAIDSKSNAGDDVPFVVMYSNSTETDVIANYYEIESNEDIRTLVIQLPVGYKELTISGTQVVPEFPLIQLAVVLSIATSIMLFLVQNRLWKK